MNRKDIEEYISSFIDNEAMDDETKAFISDAIQNDPQWNREYHSILAIKKGLSRKGVGLGQTTPESVRLNIMRAIDNEATLQAQASEPVRSSLFQLWIGYGASQERRRTVYAIAAVLALATFGAYYFFAPTSGRDNSIFAELPYSNEADNFIFRSYCNFQEVSRGSLTVDHKTGSMENLRLYFKRKGVNYDIVAPQSSFQLIGGIVTEHKGAKIAHMVLQRDGELIYMCQAPIGLFRSKAFALDGKIMDIIRDEGVNHWESSSKFGNLALFKMNSIVCSMVSNLARHEFQKLLIENGEA